MAASEKCHFIHLWPPGELCPAHHWCRPPPHSGTDQSRLNGALTEQDWRCSDSHCNQAALHDPGRPSSPEGREKGGVRKEDNSHTTEIFIFFPKTWHQIFHSGPSQILLYLDHIVFGHQDRLFLLQAVGASLAPNLGPLDPGGLMGWTGTGAEGEEAGEENGFGQLLANGLMGHLPHIHHRVCVGYAWREEKRGEDNQWRLVN